MDAQYDYLIVGAGLYGAVFAHEATAAGKRCLVIDKRSHAGGNVYCSQTAGINVHHYGAHIFHTNDAAIWQYVNRFVTFNHYVNSPVAISNGKLYNLPFNMNTFYQLWGTTTPQAAMDIIATQVAQYGTSSPTNLEEQALSLVGYDVYNTLIKEYTEKQWGQAATSLPSFIIKRLPLRYTYNNNYFNDAYQGIPKGGYNVLINGLLAGIEVRLNVDYFKEKNTYNKQAAKVVYTGKLDEYYEYCYGQLAYRSLRFAHEVLDTPNYQGNAVVNYINKSVPYTRILEHKHFEFGTQAQTVITKEYPETWDKTKEAYYPINDAPNQALYKQYSALASQEVNTIFGGRLAEYKYYDMHQIIAAALTAVKKQLQ